MPIYEDENLIAKASPIHGVGLFAKRDFKKGEIVCTWDPVRHLSQNEFDMLTLEEKKYIAPLGSEYVEVSVPARFVNHADDANTEAIDGKDITVRDIRAGEEITADYRAEGVELDF